MNNEKDILNLAKTLKGKTLKEILKERQIDLVENYKDKGDIGNIIQEVVFNIPRNSSPEPDFKPLGIDMELKVTPIKLLKNENISAKERLSLNMIDYHNYPEDFYQSHLFNKMNKMLIINYLPRNGKYNALFTNAFVFDFNKLPKNEQETILNDYDIIYQKIKDGLADDLSQKDTKILAANRKGQGEKTKSEKKVKQPNSDTLVYKRGFSLKPSYMTLLNRRNVDNSIDLNFKEYVDNGYEAIYEFLIKLKGVDLNSFNINNESKSKSRNGDTIRRLIKDWNKDYYQMIVDHQVKVRTMILDNNGMIQESFPISTNYIIREEIINENNFKNSRFYKELNLPYIILTINESNNQRIVNSVTLLRNFLPTNEYKEHAYYIWNNTKEYFKNLYNPNQNGFKMISLKDDLIFHNRPKARNSKNVKYKYENTNLTRQAFWINNKDLTVLLESVLKK